MTTEEKVPEQIVQLTKDLLALDEPRVAAFALVSDILTQIVSIAAIYQISTKQALEAIILAAPPEVLFWEEELSKLVRGESK